MEPVTPTSFDTQILMAVIGLLTLIANGVIGYYMAQLNLKQGEAAKEVGKVKQALITSTVASNRKVEAVKETLEAHATARTLELKAVKESLAGSIAAQAQKADEVKRTLLAATAASEIKFQDLATVAASTHALVNSKMAAQLRLAAAVTRRLADLTGNPADLQAAQDAADLLQDHNNRQDALDARTARQRGGAEPC